MLVSTSAKEEDGRQQVVRIKFMSPFYRSAKELFHVHDPQTRELLLLECVALSVLSKEHALSMLLNPGMIEVGLGLTWVRQSHIGAIQCGETPLFLFC